MTFKNESNFAFKEITTEQWREYRWERGGIVRISSPVMLHVSASGGHRIFDESGTSHYIPTGWVHLSWKAKIDAPHFSF